MNAATAAGGQRIKLLLIPVLALSLAGVLFWPADDEAEDGPAVTNVGASGETAPAASAPTGTGAQPPAGEKARGEADLWKAVDLSAVERTNPFASLHAPIAAASEGGAAVAASEGSAATGEPASAAGRITRRLDAIVTRNGKSYACIDDQVATVGDLLQDGARIVSITADSVVLEPGP